MYLILLLAFLIPNCTAQFINRHDNRLERRLWRENRGQPVLLTADSHLLLCGSNESVVLGDVFNFDNSPSYRIRHDNRRQHWRSRSSDDYQPRTRGHVHQNRNLWDPWVNRRAHICTWNFYTKRDDCELTAYLNYFKLGDPRCDSQHLHITDGINLVRLCGLNLTQISDKMPSATGKLIVTYYRMPYLQATRFSGFVKCEKKESSTTKQGSSTSTSAPLTTTATSSSNANATSTTTESTNLGHSKTV